MKHVVPYPCVKCGATKQPGIKCAPCRNARERRYYAEDIDNQRARCRAKDSTPHGKELKRIRSQNNYIDKRDIRKAYNAEWQRANPEANNAKRERWRKKYPDKVSAQSHRRRSRLLGAEGTFTDAEWSAVKRKQKFRCFDCNKKIALTVGHLIPLCLGGSNYISNIVAQCQSCNSMQGAKVHYSVEPMAASF